MLYIGMCLVVLFFTLFQVNDNYTISEEMQILK